MKKFYVHYGDFANTYRLAWAETPEQVEEAEKRGYERITRKEAENLCAEENRRRKENTNFSGYADNLILPIDFDREWGWAGYEKMHKNRYIIDADNSQDKIFNEVLQIIKGVIEYDK